MKENKKIALLLEGALVCILITNIIMIAEVESPTIILRIGETVFFIFTIAWYYLIPDTVTVIKNKEKEKLKKVFHIVQMACFIYLGFVLQVIVENILANFNIYNLGESVIIIMSGIHLFSLREAEIENPEEDEEKKEEALD